MKVNVGLVGFGVIGSGVVSLLQEHAPLLKARSGVEIALTRVADIDPDRTRGVELTSAKLSRDYREVLDDPNIDIVVELVGGTTAAYQVVAGALEANKHVVTANKALLYERSAELYAHAKTARREIRFEGSVAGGIPIIKAMAESLVSDRVTTIYGILNGTTNFILTRMIEEQWPFQDALARAKQLGFAEADPTLDINGSDAQHKLYLLASVAFDTMPVKESILREGIESIELLDVLYAKELGYVVKLLGIAKLENQAMSLRVHPTLIPEGCALASVKNEFNAVMLRSDFLGPALFVGRGAGARPTATAVVGDIVDIAEGMLQNREFSASRYTSVCDYPTLASGEIVSRYYLRLATNERPGILATITKILGDEQISISAIHQKEGDEPIPIVILTRVAREQNVRRAAAAIDALDFTRGRTVVLHVEDIDL